jgi:hypothetical protein
VYWAVVDQAGAVLVVEVLVAAAVALAAGVLQVIGKGRDFNDTTQ